MSKFTIFKGALGAMAGNSNEQSQQISQNTSTNFNRAKSQLMTMRSKEDASFEHRNSSSFLDRYISQTKSDLSKLIEPRVTFGLGKFSMPENSTNPLADTLKFMTLQ